MNSKICVILHLYYIDLWDEMISYLNNITDNYDIYITMTKNSQSIDMLNYTKLMIEKDNRLNGNLQKISIIDNIGLDIGAFLYTINDIINSNIQYKYIVKIHTKKSIHDNRNSKLGKIWRYDLMNSILGSSEKVNNIITILDNDNNIGIIGSKTWLVTKKHIGYVYNHNYIKYYINKFKINTEIENMSFIGGSIFWSRFDVLYNFFKTYNALELRNELEKGAFTDSFEEKKTHAIERILGLIYLDCNKKIIGI